MTDAGGPEGQGYADLGRAFAEAGLPSPPVPDELAAKLIRVGEFVWSTRAEDSSVGRLFDRIRAAATSEGPDYLVVGCGGYGLASNTLAYCLVLGRLRVFASVGWGNVYADPELERARAADTFDEIADLLLAARRATDGGWLGPAEQLVVAESETDVSGWAVLPLPASPVDLLSAKWSEGAGDTLREATAALAGTRDDARERP